MREFRSGMGLTCVVLATLLGACASGPPKTEATAALGAANDAVAHARDDNALAASPDVAAEAQQRLVQAQTALNNGDTATAIRLANEAKADADLADATARAAQAQKASSAVQSDIGAMQSIAPKP
jgi:hypothetical protein